MNMYASSKEPSGGGAAVIIEKWNKKMHYFVQLWKQRNVKALQ